MTATPEMLRAFAEVLAYPGADVGFRAAECAEALAVDHPAAAERLARFAGFARAAGLAALEEAYTAAFDLAPVASPYMGDQLFGASGERALLLAGLRELQQGAGIATGAELPDHVSEVLRLVAAPIPAAVRDDLVAEGLAPALQKMLAALERAGHPWADAVAAVAGALGTVAEAPASNAVEVVS